MVYAYLSLGVLATVEEDAEAVDVDHLPATVTSSGGQGCAGTEYGGVEVHC